MKLTLLGATAALLLSSCQSTKLEPYIGTPPDTTGLAQFLPKQSSTIHERNFQIWLKNQTAVKGLTAFNSTGPCPDAMGHGH